MDASVNILVEKAETYAIRCHRETNHFYGKDKQPYEVHLGMVVDAACKFLYLTPDSVDIHEVIIAACWTHDLIEDCRQTYNDVKENTSEAVAEITYALTNEKGRNRKERANENYYAGIRNTPCAVFVKLCDRIANLKYSVENGDKGKVNMYTKEMDDFVLEMGYFEPDHKYEAMFKYLKQLAIVPDIATSGDFMI